MTISAMQAADDVFSRAEVLVQTSVSIADLLVAGDLLRSTLAFSVAALETYLHWAIADTPLAASTLPSALGGLDVPLADMVALSEAVVADRQSIRPKARVRNTLERVILEHTFQSPKGVADALLMLGKRNAFAKISSAIRPAQTAQEIQVRLGGIVRRRNQIVHEGDLQRQSRPQNLRREPVQLAAVQSDIAWLRTFVHAIDAIL